MVAIVASSQRGPQELMNRLNAVMKEYGMQINLNKTKVMSIGSKIVG